MKVLRVRPKGIYVDLEFGIEQIDSLLEVLSHSKIKYDSEGEPEFIKDLEYVTKELIPELEKLVTDIKGET